MKLIGSILLLSMTIFAEEEQCVDKLANCETLKPTCDSVPTQLSCPVTCGTCGQSPPILDLPQFSDTICEDTLLPGMCENIDEATCLSHEKFLTGCRKSCNNCDDSKTISGDVEENDQLDILQTKETLEKLTDILNDSEVVDSDDSEPVDLEDETTEDAPEDNISTEETVENEDQPAEDALVDTNSITSTNETIAETNSDVEEPVANENEQTIEPAVEEEGVKEEPKPTEEMSQNEDETINETSEMENDSKRTGARPVTDNSGVRFNCSFILGLISMGILIFV